ncbi:hypothetical protein GGX14DRAFT_404809 [Mycena pura]|uniref:Uncharacterized protein n=1 Tax=Mycena pura TaxID=153505 RepID=A0AAD6V087_9AGAR|nr:hypothetical protein GGX14DRAFT_404809 [Mycena pura]
MHVQIVAFQHVLGGAEICQMFHVEEVGFWVVLGTSFCFFTNYSKPYSPKMNLAILGIAADFMVWSRGAEGRGWRTGTRGEHLFETRKRETERCFKYGSRWTRARHGTHGRRKQKQTGSQKRSAKRTAFPRVDAYSALVPSPSNLNVGSAGVPWLTPDQKSFSFVEAHKILAS